MPTRLFLPVRVLSRLFRRSRLARLVAAYAVGQFNFFGEHAGLADADAFRAFLKPRRIAPSGWPAPSARSPGAVQVLSYLARYTHRVAIADSRLIGFDISFKVKDYRKQGPEERSVDRGAAYH